MIYIYDFQIDILDIHAKFLYTFPNKESFSVGVAHDTNKPHSQTKKA